MLKRSRRLRAAEVARVIRLGRPYRGRLLTAKAIPAPDGTMRTAAVVSKAVAKQAVERNRLRRALYRALAGLPAPSFPALHVVFFVHMVPKESLATAFARDITHMLSGSTS